MQRQLPSQTLKALFTKITTVNIVFLKCAEFAILALNAYAGDNQDKLSKKVTSRWDLLHSSLMLSYLR